MPDWRMGLAPDVTGSAFGAFQQGQQAKQQELARGAMTAYATNPNDQTLNALSPYQPEYVIQQKQAQAEAQKQQEAAAKQAEQQRMQNVAKLFSGVTDEASYQRSLAVAGRMGLDLNGVPPNYDPNWVAENGAIMNFLAGNPEALSAYGKVAVDAGFKPGTQEFNDFVMGQVKADAMKVYPTQPGGGLYSIDSMSGNVSTLVAPNPGGVPMGAPAGGAPQGPIPTVSSVEEAKKLPPGTQFYDPNGVLRQVPGGPTPQASGGFPAFSRAIIGQESGGRYGVANAEGSGAMGIGQIMPDTARSLSKRLGIPYRPDLLAGTSPEAQRYQNALTNAALQEAWDYGGGDVRKAAYYYFAGPDTSKWGPKTRQYGEDIMRRMGGR